MADFDHTLTVDLSVRRVVSVDVINTLESCVALYEVCVEPTLEGVKYVNELRRKKESNDE